MKRDELIEAMARGMHEATWGPGQWDTLETEHREMRAMSTAALAAIEAAGAVVVPREASSAMIRDGVSYRLSTALGGDNRWPEDTAALYTAMIAASPYGGR